MKTKEAADQEVGKMRDSLHRFRDVATRAARSARDSQRNLRLSLHEDPRAEDTPPYGLSADEIAEARERLKRKNG